MKSTPRIGSQFAGRVFAALGAVTVVALSSPPVLAARADAVTVTGAVTGAGSLAGLVVRPEALETASPNRYAPARDCTAPCTTTSTTGTYSLAAAVGATVSAVRASDGAGVQVTVPASGTALPTVPLWTSPVQDDTADGHLALTWTPPAAGASSYSVELQSNGSRLGTVTTAKPSISVDERLVEDASLIVIVRADGTVDGQKVVWQAPFALVPSNRPKPASRGTACVVTTASGSQARDDLSACGLADGDLTNPAMLPGGANPQRAALDLGTAVQVGLVVVRAQGLVVVQTSTDGTTWTTLDTVVDQDPVTGAYVQRLDTPVQARYVGVVAAAGTSAAPPTSAAPTPPAETSSAPPVVVTSKPVATTAAPAPVRTSAVAPPPTTAAAPPTTGAATLPSVVPTTSSAPPRTTAPAPTATTAAPPTSPAATSAAPAAARQAPAGAREPAAAAPDVPAVRGERVGALAAGAGALPVLAELSVWTGPQSAISGDVAPSPVAVPGVSKSAGRSSGGSSALPVLGGVVLAIAIGGAGLFVVLRRRGSHAMGS